MKKTFLIGCLTLIIGAVLLVTGITMGGQPNVYWQHGLHVDHEVTRSANIADVNQIVINGTDAGGVSIHRGDVAHVQVTAPKSQAAQFHVSQHQLTITGRGNKAISLVHFTDVAQPPIAVTIPRQTQIQQITINGRINVHVDGLTLTQLTSRSAGDLTLTNTTVTNQLNLPKRSDGDITLSNVTAAKAVSIDTGGDLTIKNSDFSRANTQLHDRNGDITLRQNVWSTLQLTSTSGDITLANETVLDSLQAQAKDGDINAQIAPQPDTTISATSTNGDVSLYDQAARTFGKGQTPAKYRFRTTNGDINVIK